MHTPPPPVVSLAQYTTKDFLLYALGVGCCAGNNNGIGTDADAEIKYVYEHHHDFAPLPTFPLSLSFTALPAASEANCLAGSIRSFPPHTMENTLPRQFIAADSDFDPSSCPILHIAQSLRLHKPIPTPDLTGDDRPIRIKLVTTILSVTPKDIGTFVTTETEYWATAEPTTLLFTGTSTALVVGAPKEAVLSFRCNSKNHGDKFYSIGATSPYKRQGAPPSFEEFFRINPNQALIYRLSGDYNPIHVDSDLAAMAMGNRNRRGGDESSVPRPVLHGLCSLGFAVRGVLRFLRQKEASLATAGTRFEVTYLSCSFARPIYVGDKIKLSVWDDDSSSVCNGKDKVLRFEVHDCALGRVAIKDGIVAILAHTTLHVDKTPSTPRSSL